MQPSSKETIEKALASKAWPFEEAAAIVERIGGKTPAKGYVLFETGYGPSGLPHIGTFGEVARTTMVMNAFKLLTGGEIPCKLFAFSDDMDGLRKVPDNIPNPEIVAKYLGKPLTSIPDPFGTHESYGYHMNSRLQGFLDRFGFEYEFKSATDCYKSGMFDKALLAILEKYTQVADVVLPTLGDERRETYSPFMPVSRVSGNVLQTSVVAQDAKAGTITYIEEDGSKVEIPVTGGNTKLQWKADWGMRWAALGVDYEMYGKDLIPSAELSGKICEIIGGKKPNGFSYELFLDEKGQKISKSKGNGITIEEWLKFAPADSLALYMFQSPRKAKRLYFDVIPRQVDDYQTFLSKYLEQDEAARFANPAWHIHKGNPPQPENANLTFGLLLNLASACNPEDKSVLWGFISRYAPDATPATCPKLDELAGFAVQYYHSFVKPAKKYRLPDALEAAALQDLADWLEKSGAGVTSEEIQNEVYALGKKHPFADLKNWFQALYEVLLGQSQGPRMGSFIALYGVSETMALIKKVLKGEDLAAA